MHFGASKNLVVGNLIPYINKKLSARQCTVLKKITTLNYIRPKVGGNGGMKIVSYFSVEILFSR